MCKKDIILFVSIFCVLALISGSTFAYWGWESNVNKSVVFNTSHGIEDYINYDEGDSHFVGNFQPTANYCNNTIYNTISFNKKSADVEIPLIANIYMDVNHIADSIKNSDNVYWALIAGDSSSCTGVLSDALAYGKFKNISSGTTITLLENIWIGTNTTVYNQLEYATSYTIYIWIDSSGSNSSLSGSTIDVNIWTQIDQFEAWYGDLNLDGRITAEDMTLLTGYVAENAEIADSVKAIADLNADGIIDANDITIMSNFVAGIDSCTLPYSPCIK